MNRFNSLNILKRLCISTAISRLPKIKLNVKAKLHFGKWTRDLSAENGSNSNISLLANLLPEQPRNKMFLFCCRIFCSLVKILYLAVGSHGRVFPHVSKFSRKSRAENGQNHFPWSVNRTAGFPAENFCQSPQQNPCGIHSIKQFSARDLSFSKTLWMIEYDWNKHRY